MKDFTYSFHSSKSPEAVFGILMDVRKWWSGFFEETITGESSKQGDEFSFRAGGGAHYSKQQLAEYVPGKKLVWKVTDSDLSFLEETGEWTGTRFGFDVSEDLSETKVTFTHYGLVPEKECFHECSAGWMKYLGKLKEKLA